MQAQVAKICSKNESSNREIVKKEKNSCWCYYCTSERTLIVTEKSQEHSFIEETSTHVVCVCLCVCMYVCMCTHVHVHAQMYE